MNPDHPAVEVIQRSFLLLAAVGFALAGVTGLLIASETMSLPVGFSKIHARPFGEYLHALHLWAGSTAIFGLGTAVWWQLASGGYERNTSRWCWSLGGLVLLVFGSTVGNILPWDSAGHDVASIGAATIGAVPRIGGWLKATLVGDTVTAAGLLPRAFTLHTMIMPVGVTVIFVRLLSWPRRNDVPLWQATLAPVVLVHLTLFLAWIRPGLGHQDVTWFVAGLSGAFEVAPAQLGPISNATLVTSVMAVVLGLLVALPWVKRLVKARLKAQGRQLPAWADAAVAGVVLVVWVALTLVGLGNGRAGVM